MFLALGLARPSAQEQKLQSTGKVFTKEQLVAAFPPTHACARDACSICMEPIVVEDGCRELPCSHAFHTDCIVEWWMAGPSELPDCPMCRCSFDITGAAVKAQPAEPAGAAAPVLLGARLHAEEVGDENTAAQSREAAATCAYSSRV
mmetsp:Transcript_41751/g.121132  ORF Transcript_41751/g.121132 Transcript_41751/m.121132 type:complete len:147 (-) Transcript_41751:319-759(-)